MIHPIFIRLELKQMLRSRWMQLVALLFLVVFAAIAIILQMAVPDAQGFTRQTATFLNLLLFLLPLFVLTIGSMGVASDIESGWFSLLKTYPMKITQYVFSKFMALLVAFSFILALVFGVLYLIGGLVGKVQIPLLIILLSLQIVLIFAALAILVGVVAKSRLHALALSLVVWAFALLILSYVLMAAGTFVAGHVLQNLTIVYIHLNPAEWVRFGYFLLSGQSAVLGPAFYDFTNFYSSSIGYVVYGVVTVLWLVLPIWLASFMLKRKEHAK